jgi:hypothetical protein
MIRRLMGRGVVGMGRIGSMREWESGVGSE